MARRIAAAFLAALVLAAGSGVPGATEPVAAGSCSSWTSERQPPPAIRVFRSTTGAVETVDFRAYAKNVLSREWIGSWTTESLRSGALAVKNYAWYQVLHWRGYVNDAGQCFDVFDTARDQVYDPSRATWASAAAAVDATWSTLALKSGHVFPTYYNAGAPGEACGANANGWKMYQWGTQACGLAGRTAAQIMSIYYADVLVTDAPPAAPAPSSPTPAPTTPVTPAPTTTATASPATTPPATPVITPTPAISATPAPTAAPVPTPVAAPLPTAPAGEAPGGGQSGVVGVSAPPPPPPPSPRPIVVKPAAKKRAPHATSAPVRSIRATRMIPEGPDLSPTTLSWGRGEMRLASFGILFPQALDRLIGELGDRLLPPRTRLLLALLGAA